MHYEFLTEDQSGKVMLERLLPKLLPADAHTYNVHHYKGIGHIPKGMKPTSDANKRILLDQLPRLLSGYGKAYGKGYPLVVIVVCDLDDRNKASFEKELKSLADNIRPCPSHAFCLAVEEGEAWFLGDKPAIKAAYPSSKKAALANYVQDSICGTWECLADAVYPGGSEALSEEGWRRVGQEKTLWAQNITPHMTPDANASPSFNRFKTTVLKFALP